MKNDLEKYFRKLSKKIEKAGAGELVPLDRLFTTSFISKNTRFSSPTEILSMDESKLTNEYISSMTDFYSFDEMVKQAGIEYKAKKIENALE